ncbi:hypothetical protein FLONG3_10132 [Fusarium longipes]|uniref:Uncharacterized protein n=1 Tax=Fusarium longipes TaxID=694270 RepID=A0A395RSG8_9HYPO|nr:hypothetical protein FLONG3_10132 [Fusarium longipes]
MAASAMAGDTFNISGGVFNHNSGGGSGRGGRRRGGRKLTRRQAKNRLRRAQYLLDKLGPAKGGGTNPPNSDDTNPGNRENTTSGEGDSNRR